MSTRNRGLHRREPHTGSLSSRLNWLRAGVLGANDGIVSTSGLVVGVSATTTDVPTIAAAGIAGVVAGAVSMALGEYVSVSAQRDTEEALVRQEHHELQTQPEDELNELVTMLRMRGLKPQTAAVVADELTAHDPLGTHLELELGMSQTSLANPWSAAASSALAFTIGALLPLVAILLPPPDVRLWVTVAATLLALALTGAASARLGRAHVPTAVVRLVAGGALAMGVTYAIGEAVDWLI